MKVQLIVVRGKPEGKVIPLNGPKFRIGRGETCHLRPNSEQVSREHAEFSVVDGVVTVADLGSRNGTQVKGQTLPKGQAYVLKDRDLVQVGPLTFAVSIQGAPVVAAKASPAPVAVAAASPKPASAPAAGPKPARSAPEDVLNEDIDSWLVGEPGGSSVEIPTSVYGGDTITIAAYDSSVDVPVAKAPAPQVEVPTPQVEEPTAEEEEVEEEEVEEAHAEAEDFNEPEDEEEEDEEEDEEDDEEESDEDEAPVVEEFLDESNPFYAAKKAQQQAAKAPAGKAAAADGNQFQDSSDAAGEILRKLMERRRASR